ncbi:UDP-N-acetyl-2-amino-2-deoxy-D-glucuronate oxidase [Roseibium album]|nr:UDP-N-acetyl-2-amino-2-deoxy-D-glucuronate oxidase [Roseibium album]
MNSKYFALIGAAGFVAPRHLRAIHETGGNLCAAVDRSDSVGVIDSYFPDARFFTEFEHFDRYLDLLRRQNQKIDYFSICSPNYLHDAHIRFALRSQSNAICEKPLVLKPSDLDGLADMEAATGQNIYSILQLRLHPSIIKLREKILAEPKDKIYEVDLTYITSRGSWYFTSWKGNESKSGGIAANIGVHFFDMLGFVFGDPGNFTVHHRAADCAAGHLEYERARVRWFLSINTRDLPPEIVTEKKTFRSITIDGEEIEFSEGFTDLHTASYKHIHEGHGFGLTEARQSIETVSAIQSAPIMDDPDRPHPFLSKALSDTERYEDGWPY